MNDKEDAIRMLTNTLERRQRVYGFMTKETNGEASAGGTGMSRWYL